MGICQSGHEHTASAINDEASGEGVIEPWDTCLIFLSSTRTLPDLSRASTPSKTCTFLSRIELGGPLVAPAACCAPAPPVAHRGLFAFGTARNVMLAGAKSSYPVGSSLGVSGGKLPFVCSRSTLPFNCTEPDCNASADSM